MSTTPNSPNGPAGGASGPSGPGSGPGSGPDSPGSSPGGASDPGSASGSGGGAWRALLPAGTFLAGAGLASAVLLAGGAGDDPVLTAPVPSPSATAEAAADVTGSTLLVRVPAACVEAAEFTDVVTGSLGDLAAAARDFDARRLQETLDALQRVRPQVEAASEQCRDLAAAGEIVTAPPVAPADASPQTAPSPLPSAVASPVASGAEPAPAPAPTP